MGIVRALAGFTRQVMDPRNDRDSRRNARREVANLAVRQATPQWLDASALGRLPDPLFPKAYGAFTRPRRSTTLILSLGGRPPRAVADTNSPWAASDVIDLSPQAPSDAVGSAAPGSWTAGRRVLSAINAGLLEGYETVVVTSSGALPPQGTLDVLEHSPFVGGVSNELAAASHENIKRANRILTRRHWPRVGPDAPIPTTFDFSCRAFVLRALAAIHLPPEEVPHDGQDEVFLALLGGLAAEAGAPFITTDDVTAPHASLEPPRVVPFYLPQFHPTPENDAWWGEGFTEWTNVASARPSFRGHRQPKLPRAFGFYDLRVDEVRQKQASMARDAGVAGLMYYHYWFAGDRLLDLPLARHIDQKTLDLPFCLMWANEDWTRSWDGDLSAVLKAQDYDRVPAAQFLDHALDLLRDHRYLSVDGKKVLAVYRPTSIPDFPDVAEAWRSAARAAGMDLHLLGVEYDRLTPEVLSSLDATMSFPPHSKKYVKADTTRMFVRRGFDGGIFSYLGLVEADVEALESIPDTHYPGVMPAWDNTPRRGLRGHLWIESNPFTFRRWLLAAAVAVQDRPHDDRIVFVNAWNEWAEGAILEPSTDAGTANLDAVRDIVGSRDRIQSFTVQATTD